ncbi:TonB-dependent receptor [Bacteroides sp. 51]|uniref:SusC/RagA family TonB-linked outer membrane protein n=1 Tax=Bacteroides sp. 51 TaxID=2302938 RepID=UPI0013D163BF|nr:TonB-dependent receptor [Bacteroides sp. 51]NDV82617.1 TonB-dependent receptor [Bacteroides sp. 51]
MKHSKLRKALLCVFACLSMLPTVGIYAQNTITVRGNVMADGESLIGATVLVKGTQNGTATDLDGNFLLQTAPNAVLVISAIGYETQEIPVNNRTNIALVLRSDVIALQDIVVVGYGTQKKVNLTGSVSTISSADLEGKPITNLVEALQGSAPGLVIQQSNSQPGSRPSINVRGLNTMNNNDPMVIIDGIQGDIQNVNPSDIESISILKDAASTAIYGSRASNGVILITTKKGTAGRNEVQYEFQYGIQKPTSLPNMVDSWIYAEMRNEALLNSGRSIAFTPEQIAYYRNGGPNVNWLEEIYKNNSPQQSHTLSLTGGTDKTTYLVSAGYMNQESMFKGPDYGMERYNGRVNVSHQFNDRFKFNASVSYVRNEIKDHAYWTEWLIEQCTRMPTIYPIKDENGYTYPSGSNTNALARLEQGGYRQASNDDLSAVFNAEYKIWDGLFLKGMVGGQLLNNRTHENRKSIPGTGDAENRMTEQSYRTENITTNLMLTYNNSFGKHNVGAMAGYAYEGSRYKGFETYRLTETADYDIMGGWQLTNVANMGQGKDWAIYSGFGRLNYNFDERYLFEANLRYDVSSKFVKGNRGGWFPSLSGGWRISEEAFYGNMKNYVSSMKLRGSWGLVGNNRIDDYAYMSAVGVAPGYNFGSNVVNVANFAVANPDIKWETTSMIDLGIDLGFFDNSLNVTVGYFNYTTNDILIKLPVPGTYGVAKEGPVQNAAKVRNQGWEVSANYRFKTGNVEHTVAGNLSDSKNEVLDTRGEYWINGTDVNTIIREGYAMNSYYAYRSNGFFQNEQEVAAGPWLDGITPKPGDIRYLDKNNDGLVKEDDDRFILTDNFPHLTYGFSYGLKWKGFDLSMFWQGVGRRNVWLRGESMEAFHNNNEGPVFDFHLDRWTPENPGATYPRLTVGSESANNAAKSDFWIQDAAYLRLKNLQIGYTLPKEWLSRFFIKDLRVYLTGQNLLTFTDLKGGWDPETSDGGGRIYPVSKVYSVGLNVKF